MKIVSDFRLFKKICRKYWKRYAIKNVNKYHNKKFISYWTNKEFVYYYLLNPNELLDSNAYIKYHFYYDTEEKWFINSISSWILLFGKNIIAVANQSDEKITGIFRGFRISNNQVRYYIENNGVQYFLPFFWNMKLK